MHPNRYWHVEPSPSQTAYLRIRRRQTLWDVSEVSARETSHRHEPGHWDIPCRREPDFRGWKIEGLGLCQSRKNNKNGHSFLAFFLGFLDACGVESKHAGNFRGKTRTTEATIDPAQLGHHILAFWKDLPLPHCQHHRFWHMKQVNYSRKTSMPRLCLCAYHVWVGVLKAKPLGIPRASNRMFRLQSEEDQLPNTQ